MLRGNAIDGMVSLLQQRNASLWHACNFQDFRAYMVLGGVPSRAILEQSGLVYTGFETDDNDHANGVWDKVFVNLSDFGDGFARGYNAVPNAYGPIVLQISPNALREAADVAVCLRSAGARDFNREAEALPSVELVDRLFCSPLGSDFPRSAKVRHGNDLRAVFSQAKSSNPEISCTIPSGCISSNHVVAVWTDPYLIAGKALREWVQQTVQARGLELRIHERSCSKSSRRKMYAELAELVNQGYRSLASIERSDLVSDAMRAWAGETLKNEIDYNFRRYADYMFSGTLQLIIHGTIPVMPPPRGSYVERFSRLLALKRQPTPEAIGEIIAGLGDEDERIRWLAGSVLLALKHASVVTAVRAFAEQTESAEGRMSAQDWLRRVGA